MTGQLSQTWLRHWFARRCKHPSDQVTADILDGDFHGGPGGTQGVQWCRRCGAYRRAFTKLGEHGPEYPPMPVKEWTIPYA